MNVNGKHIGLFAVLLLLDHIVKFSVLRILSFSESVWIIPQLVYFRLHYNTGFAFGMGANYQWLLIIVVILLIGLFSFVYVKEQRYRWPLVFILAGAVGNLIDRFVYYPNGVLDFIGVTGFSIFNLADTWITIGGVLLALTLLRKKS